MYVCSNCRRDIDALQENRVRCPHCGYRLLFKRRPPVVKEVDAV
ncbi:MAG: DNA-directed RNA polymerase subunit P [Candidatus Diapherotrites archaeon]|nr:DNA-directed RNA polymerase subunit P [Candidatus Diapherotrites archaeon]